MSTVGKLKDKEMVQLANSKSKDSLAGKIIKLCLWFIILVKLTIYIMEHIKTEYFQAFGDINKDKEISMLDNSRYGSNDKPSKVRIY